jgi:hypothetical protein
MRFQSRKLGDSDMMKERKRNGGTALLPISIVLSAVVLLVEGCYKNLDVPDTQLLKKNLPQHFKLAITVEEAWQSVRTQVTSNPACRVLVEEPKSHLISWAEPAENWRDLGQDVVDVDNPFAYTNAAKKIALEPTKGIAVTTLWIESADSGCKMHVRRVYYGAETYPGVAHSRGDYEHNLAGQL